jgi:hypothetical protein
MNDLTPKTTQEVRRYGMVGVGAGISGLGLLILNDFAGGWGGLVVGGLVALGGLGIMGSKDGKDKRLGGLVTAAGAVTAGAALFQVLPGFQGLAHLGSFVLWASGIGLLGLGVWNIIKFVKGLKSRA